MNNAGAVSSLNERCAEDPKRIWMIGKIGQDWLVGAANEVAASHLADDGVFA